jgi:hypothetical protein
MVRRAAISSSGEEPTPSNSRPLTPVAPALSVTKAPAPTRTSTRPAISSAIIASRTVGRLTPNSLARSRSGGSRSPGLNSPRATRSVTWPATCS